MDICCIRLDKTELSDSKEKPSLLFLFVDEIWTIGCLSSLDQTCFEWVWSQLLWSIVSDDYTTALVQLSVFGIFFFTGMCLIPRVQVGLDQSLALPSVSEWASD